jgi:diguanylate cyclase (GGDEF)-like protein
VTRPAAPACDPLRDPLREARETGGMTSRIMLGYAERAGGREAVEAVLEHAGLAGREAELRDENTWFSFATKVRLFEALVAVLDDPEATRRAGAAALELNVGEGLKVALRALGSPRLVYQHIVRANGRFSARHAMELLELGTGHARLRFVDVTGAAIHPLDCRYNVGLLSCIPALFGQPPARVTHPVCAVDGGEACIYEVTWERSALTVRSLLASGAAAGGSLLVAALAAPALLPVAGAVAATAIGAIGVRAARTRRASWRRLEADASEQATVAERLNASLQDLVSELRLEELLDKIVHNARAAVAGKEFALLVDEDGGLTCRGSTGLPPASVATLECWAAEAGDLREPALVEDVVVVPALAALAADADVPMRSLCAVPLVYRGDAVGLLVALSAQARTFLPRDVDLVRSYGVQAAIALSNARLFAAQHALAVRDGLTGLLNHREFHEALDRELARCRRSGAPASIVLVDLDGFKQVNDASGHAEGDRVLRDAAAALAGACRGSDLAFRLGGDEFALLLPETTATAARRVADRAAAAVAAADPRTSASYGVASWPADGGSKDVLLAHADAAVYAMKGERASDGRAPSAPAHPAALQRARLQVAARLASELAALTDIDPILATVVAQLGEAYTFEACALRLEEGALRVVAGAPVVTPRLAAPVRVEGRLWGALGIDAPPEAAFGPDDLLLLETVAAQVGAALHRAQLVAALEAARAQRAA